MSRGPSGSVEVPEPDPVKGQKLWEGRGFTVSFTETAVWIKAPTGCSRPLEPEQAHRLGEKLLAAAGKDGVGAAVDVRRGGVVSDWRERIRKAREGRSPLQEDEQEAQEVVNEHGRAFLEGDLSAAKERELRDALSLLRRRRKISAREIRLRARRGWVR